ncbi:MAG: hypothetical protein A3A58_02325 [Candidatus Blackburnbacteria bacterium RIFCSPLOWO2_01_FULL_41_27]|uniref:DUF2029 domain-containing protein n=2 Tax=Candidatus Blackburniibacteriota TaxID=1817898 RepID=A0A1G1V7I2_9BACT|nr:MAG: hypothetical protein A3F61_03190 [Candidatus Blackburnbacteria bacterium RIFCSPHIGHO2_12_FULL_41_13b]OGY12572.1 MAG: hypothetical protein A3A58_02325 [Candidatus Blackburnbacteria bacterium RIFCSPLOWO2_01_FULL_41_27]
MIPKLTLARIISFLVVPIFLLIALQFIVSNIKLLKSPGQDFEVFYLSGQQAVVRQNSYLMLGKDIVRNPPPALLLFMLLPLLPIQLSQIIWFILSLIIFFIGSYFLFKILAELDRDKFLLPLNWKLWLLYLSLAFIFFPFRYNLGSGQVNNVLFLLIVSAFYLSQHKRWGLSALSLALAIVLKITPIFLLYTLLIEKKVQTVLSTVAYVVAIGLITGLILGFRVYGDYLSIPSSFFDFGISTYYNQSLAGFLARVSNNFELNKWLVLATLIIASISLLFVHKRLVKSSFSPSTLLWNLSILFMLIFAPFAWQYHFAIIIFPLVVTAFLGYKMKLSYRFFSLLVLSYLLIGWNIKNPTSYINSGLVGAVILSHTFIGTTLLLFLNYYLVTKFPKVKI